MALFRRAKSAPTPLTDRDALLADLDGVVYAGPGALPHAIESLDLSGFDLVLSNTHCVAKGVRKKPGALHVAYVSTPMRYIWDMFDEYFGPGKSGFLTTAAAKMVREPLQRWDVRTTAGVDHLVANSRFVQERIRKFWGRESTVIHPFLDPAKLEDRLEEPRDYYLIVSAFAPAPSCTATGVSEGLTTRTYTEPSGGSA